MNLPWMKDAVRSTLFAVLVLSIGHFFFGYNLKAINPFETLNSKVSYTDFYFSKLHENDKVDESIVLINIGEIGRSQIAETINRINRFEPAVMAVDISFIGKKDSVTDLLLKNAIDDSKNIVFPKFKNSDLQRDWNTNNGIVRGSNEFITDNQGIVKFVKLGSTPEQYLFSQWIAKLYSKDVSMNSGFYEINYLGNEKNFHHLEYSDLEEIKIAQFLKNKIVILGYAGSTWKDQNYSTDNFFTPLDLSQNRLKLPPTSGMVIHANIVKNILEEKFVKLVSPILSHILLLFILFGANIFYIKKFKRLSVRFYFESRLFQLILLSVVAYLIFLLFHLFRIKFEMAEWMITIISSFDLSMIYVFSMNYLGNKFGIGSYIHTKLNP